MNMNLNYLVINKVQSLITPNLKLPEFLADTLNISLQSTYRKIKGETSFNFEQVALLSQKLGFSMDEIIELENNVYSLFKLLKNPFTIPEDTFYNMLERYLNILILRSENKNSGIFMTMNRIFFLSGIPFKTLFRFYYYKWIHLTTDAPLDYRFSDAILPKRITALCNKIEEYLPLVSNNIYIIDPNVLSNSLVDIQYYYRRGLINDKEISAIKGELEGMVDMTENIVRKGMFLNTGSTYNYYISSLPIESNSVYFWCNDIQESHFWIYPANYVFSSEQYACSMHKNWINSLKKYSILTTMSNEELQSDYFKGQRKCLDEML